MPENQQEIAHSIKGKQFIEVGVLIGIGVLLIFLGVFSTVPLTAVVSVVIGAFLFYTAYTSYRSRTGAATVTAAGSIEEEEPQTAEQESIVHDKEESDEEYFIAAPAPEKASPPAHAEGDNVPAKKQFTATDRIAAPPKISMNTAEPQSEFTGLVTNVLRTIKDVCFANTAAFFWINHDTKQLVVEAKITDSTSFITDRKIAVGTDAVSRIGQSGSPEIVNNIMSESERDMLRYYSCLQEVRSFVGVPVFYDPDVKSGAPIGVIAVDSKAEDAFGEESVIILTHFSALLSSLVVSSTEKYDLMADIKMLQADTEARKRIAQQPTVPLLVNTLVESLERIISWDAICVVLFDDSQRAWALASVRVRGSDRFVSPKQLIDLGNSIVGNSLRTNTVAAVDLAVNRQIVFNPNESGSELLRQGMLTVVPFSSGGKCYGAVAVITKKPGAVSAKDIAAIGHLASTIAPSCEIIELNSIIGEHIAIDEQTGVYSRKYFSLRLTEELARANDRQEDLTMVLVALSNVQEIENRYGADGKETAVQSIAKQISRCIRPYDIVARFDATTFAVLLADTIANDAYIWADKLRTTVAGSIVTFDKRSFSISVTIGISGAASKMLPEELVKNTALVLDQARKAGGNIVRVF